MVVGYEYLNIRNVEEGNIKQTCKLVKILLCLKVQCNFLLMTLFFNIISIIITYIDS